MPQLRQNNHAKGAKGNKMQNNVFSSKQAFFLRLLVGIGFGLLIGYLFETMPKDGGRDAPEIWRENTIAIFGLTAFVFWAGLGVMRRYTLAIWGLVSAAIVFFMINHGNVNGVDNGAIASPHMVWIVPFLFISHELVSSADLARKPIAPYETYFDEAWKRGVQLQLSLIFTGVFWLIMVLGAKLLEIIGFKWLGDLIEEPWFWWPASGAAMAVSVHLGDVQPKLLSNFRNLVLSIFSWLLIIIVLIGGIFAVSLLFTGLKPLWDTKAATASLLGACVFLVLLINATYQNGENSINIVLKWAVRIATFETAIFALIAAYSLWLRIDQYGFTTERVFASVGVIIASAYGIAYSISNFVPLKSAQFMPNIKNTNIGLAFLKVMVFFCILTPIADPERLSVNSQINHLLAGKTEISKFDWNYLRFQSGRYGKKGLERLKKDKNPVIAKKAEEWAAMEEKKWDKDVYVNKSTETAPRMDGFALVNGSKPLPPEFLNGKFVAYVPGTFGCLDVNSQEKCNTKVMDLNNDGTDEIVFSSGWNISFFKKSESGWIYVNSVATMNNAQELAFKNGDVKAIQPQWLDMEIGGERLKMNVWEPIEPSPKDR